MELAVSDCSGLPEGSILSIRSGNTRRQALLSSLGNNALKFPSPLSTSEPLKVDILQPVMSQRLVLSANVQHYRLEQETGDGRCLSFKLHVNGEGPVNGVSDEHPPQDQSSDVCLDTAVKFTEAASCARQYLEDHNLLPYFQGLLHVVIQAKPANPYRYMWEQLGSMMHEQEEMAGTHAASTVGKSPVVLHSERGRAEQSQPKQVDFEAVPTGMDRGRSVCEPKGSARTRIAAGGLEAPQLAGGLQASENGGLAENAQPSPSQLVDMKLMLRESLADAMSSGILEDCLKEAMPPALADQVQLPRVPVPPPTRPASARPRPQPQRQQPSNENVRLQIRHALEMAAATGELADALSMESAGAPIAVANKDHGVAQLPASEQLGDDRIRAQHDDIRQVKQTLRQALKEAAETGELLKWLQDAIENEAPNGDDHEADALMPVPRPQTAGRTRADTAHKCSRPGNPLAAVFEASDELEKAGVQSGLLKVELNTRVLVKVEGVHGRVVQSTTTDVQLKLTEDGSERWFPIEDLEKVAPDIPYDLKQGDTAIVIGAPYPGRGDGVVLQRTSMEVLLQMTNGSEQWLDIRSVEKPSPVARTVVVKTQISELHSRLDNLKSDNRRLHNQVSHMSSEMETLRLAHKEAMEAVDEDEEFYLDFEFSEIALVETL